MAMATRKMSLGKVAGALLAVGLLGATLMAETGAAARYDNQIQTTVAHAIRVVERVAGLNAHQDFVGFGILPIEIVRVVGGNQRQAFVFGELLVEVVDLVLLGILIVLQ